MRRPLCQLVLCVLLFVGARQAGSTPVGPGALAEQSVRASTPAADTLLLDQYPDAQAAYSVRRLRASYEGPALRVRRTSDNAEQDFGFTQAGTLNQAAIENWLAGADGTVVRWYAQVDGMTDLVGSPGPEIARNGTVHTDPDGRPHLYLGTGGLSADRWFLPQNITASLVVEIESTTNPWDMLLEMRSSSDLRVYRTSDGRYWTTPGENKIITPNEKLILTVAGSAQGLQMYQNDAQKLNTETPLGENWAGPLRVGALDGFLGELVLYPHLDQQDVWARYDNMNDYWQVGPSGTNRGALLPQTSQYQVTLYDWLETISTDDVALPDGTLSFDRSVLSTDELADLWLQVKGLTASSVTRREPAWYTLDNGDGRGIEATGVVRANHDPQGGDYGGNPPRSWQNEPAYWYQLDIPLSGGGQGNPWYKDPAMGRRAMVVAIVDLMMHEGLDDVDSFNWFDMKGKAFLGMAEAYRWAGEVMPSDVQAAFETGMEKLIDDLTARGPRAVNTNMDMFALHGAADFYKATDDPDLKAKSIGLVKRALLGFPDGELGTKHKVFAAGGRDGGVYDPSGFIMEGGQPDHFYGGESLYHLMGALAAVTDRETATVPPDWAFLRTVVEQLQIWRSYQVFHDPANDSPYRDQNTPLFSGAGFAGRTSAGAPAGQNDKPWKKLGVAATFAPALAHKSEYVTTQLPTVPEMESDISGLLSGMTSKMASPYTGAPPSEWSGWSPWTKSTPYLPPAGWYSTLTALLTADDPQLRYPSQQPGASWNKSFGGPPVGPQYWSYKDTAPDGRAFGFFVEAQSRQGTYGGWYGGKIETFWMEEVGVVLLNRHGKTGCDRTSRTDTNFEDSVCWFNLEWKAGHHVWGRDEGGTGFTTLLLRGRTLERTARFRTEQPVPSVTVRNQFNDPSQPTGTAGLSGEQTGTEIQGSFVVENEFTAQPRGLRVTHRLASDQTDEVTELWATLPVHLRQYSEFAGPDPQISMAPTSIEYWTGTAWAALPEDQDGNGVPERVTTTALRLGRAYPIFNAPRYAYLSLEAPQTVRLARRAYHDPYQTPTSVRAVHIDLHGDPGTVKPLPAEQQVSYVLQTTDPTQESGTVNQSITLQKGSNLVATALAPTPASMDSVFADVASAVVAVQNEEGERYRPSNGVNEIGAWTATDAYVVYADPETTLAVQGDALDAPTLSLEAGWNWVPYLRDTGRPVAEAFASIADVLVLVKGEDGRVYVPSKNVNTLGDVAPGEAYKVYVREATTVSYDFE